MPIVFPRKHVLEMIRVRLPQDCGFGRLPIHRALKEDALKTHLPLWAAGQLEQRSAKARAQIEDPYKASFSVWPTYGRPPSSRDWKEQTSTSIRECCCAICLTKINEELPILGSHLGSVQSLPHCSGEPHQRPPAVAALLSARRSAAPASALRQQSRPPVVVSG
jgi:hypothetical protein